MESVEVRFQLDKKAYTHFLFIRSLSRLLKITLLGTGVLALVLLSGYIFLASPADRLISYSQQILIFIALFFPVLSASAYRKALRAYSKRQHLQNEMVYHFHQNGFEAKGLNYQVDLSWKHIIQIEEFPNWFVLYQDRSLVHHVPKSAFDTSGLQKFGQLLQPSS